MKVNLKQHIPELANPESKRAIVTQMIQYALQNGYTEQDILGQPDSRLVLMLYKAMKYDQMKQGR